MKASTILCPVDFSVYADLAVELAGKLITTDQAAGSAPGRVYLLHVIANSGKSSKPISVLDSVVNSGIEKIRELGNFPQEVKVEHLTLKGDPGKVIVEFAVRKKVDLIVMGTQGKSGMKRMLLGSVSQAVMRDAKCPVITVNSPH